jgi:hypothetical protein
MLHLGDASAHTRRRVAWCHGASGLVLTMLKAAEALGDASGRYMAAATAAADTIWERGLLRKVRVRVREPLCNCNGGGGSDRPTQCAPASPEALD